MRTIILVASASLYMASGSQAAATERPNVLLIICDDLNDYVEGYGGHPQAKTPNMARLARSGVSFTQAHCNSPICAPSRASLFTGIYPHHSGCYGFTKWDTYEVLKNSRTIMDHFRANGYTTLGTGKLMHHMVRREWKQYGNPADYGPFAFANGEKVAHPNVPAPYREIGPVDGSFGPFVSLAGRKTPDGHPLSWHNGGWGNRAHLLRVDSPDDRDQTPDEVNGDWAVENIRSLTEHPGRQPFFMGVGFIRPHTPLIVPQRFFDMFPWKEIELPLIRPGDVEDTHARSIRGIPNGAEPTSPRTEDMGTRLFKHLVASYPSRDEALRRFIQAYLASVASVDEQIGRILDAVDRSHLKDNTIIILTSDHGWGMGEKDYLYKNSLWQESTRIPLIMRAPKIAKAGSTCGQPVSLIDLYPTLIDLCGISGDTKRNDKGHPLDGHSLKPLLADPEAGQWSGPNEALTTLYKWRMKYDPSRESYSLRSRDWRYIRYENGKEELYHTADDPLEWHNLADKPDHVERLASFRMRLLARLPEPGSIPPQPVWRPKDSNNSKSDAEAWKDKGLGRAEPREVHSLDGTWEVLFDSDNVGRAGNWHQENVFSARSDRRDIEVPSCWELIEQDYEGVAYYRRKFHMPASWVGKTVRLQFDAVNYLTEVWLNDEVVGFHEGGFTPFEFRVDKLLKPGQENQLILRVVGPIILQDKRIDGVGPLETPQWRGGITGGIWQSVRLVATGEALIKDVFIIPKIADGSATFNVELENTDSASRSVQLVTMIRRAKDPDRILAKSVRDVSLRPGVSQHKETIQVPDARYWSPDDPHLYQADVALAGSDYWTSQFGMREFTIRNKQFHLNGKPIYLKATFFEGLYPTRIAYPDNREMAAREIQLAKDAGFNMIRPWRRPPAPMWLDLADEMGVLVVGSPVLECMRLPLSTPYLPARVEHEIRETVLRDRNRACVVQWELFNELHRPILKQMMRPMALLTRELDPTRLILDESGGWAFGAQMYLPSEYEPIRFNDIHTYPGPLINKRLYDGFLSIGLTEKEKKSRGLHAKAPGRNVVPGLMSFVSELGYGSLPNLVDSNERFRRDGNPLTPAYRYHHRLADDQQRVLKESGFDDLYPDLDEFCLDQQSIHGAANKRMIEAVRSNPNVNGYCIHALSAGDWILGAGLIDLWRQPKTYAYEATQAANQSRILAIRMSPRNIYASRGSDVQVIGVNEQDALNAILSLRIASASGETVFSKEVRTKWNEGVSTLFAQQLDTRVLRGSYTIRATVSTEDGPIVTKNAYTFDVFTQQDLVLPETQIAVLDLDGPFTRFLKKQGIDAIEFDVSTPRLTPVFVTRVTAKSPSEQQRFADLMRFIEAGGTAVYIQGVGKDYARDKSNQVQSPTVPFAARVEAARGLWTCIPHLVRKHPILAGLPADGMMRDIYENVWATQTLRDLEGDAIVASIGFKWFSDDHKLHYAGPGESWWGADLAIVSKGRGRIVVSQLRLLESLGRDPVADRLLKNLISFVANP